MDIKSVISDIKAEVEFILLDVQTSQKISKEGLDELFKWTNEIGNLIEGSGIKNDVFVDNYKLIHRLGECLVDKKIEINETIIKILISYFKALPEMGELLEDEALTVETMSESSFSGGIIEDLEEILAEVKEVEYAEKDALSDGMSNEQLASSLRDIFLFKLNGVKYGIELNKIQEVIVLPEHITRLPGLKEMVLGVINLRGEVTPLIDCRLWFRTRSKDEIKYSELDIIISVKNETGKIIGLVIDEIEDVVQIDLDKILPVTQSVDIPSEFLKGLMNYGKDETDMIVVLDVDALLTEDTLVSTIETISR